MTGARSLAARPLPFLPKALAGTGVQPHPQAGCAPGIQALGQQGASRSAHRPARRRPSPVPALAQRQLPARGCHQCAGPFEYTDAVITPRQLARGAGRSACTASVAMPSSRAASPGAGEDAATGQGQRGSRQQVQGIGIPHLRPLGVGHRRQQAAPQAACPRPGPTTSTEARSSTPSTGWPNGHPGT
jgi:hypothetical protein